jgi:uncharacterized Rmd1/YagE family protein
MDRDLAETPFRRHSDTEPYREEKTPLLKQSPVRLPTSSRSNANTKLEYGSLPNPSKMMSKIEDLRFQGKVLASMNIGEDDFADANTASQYKNIKSGRQRKKIASRTKGGEFQARRRKRRLYFCCISSEIDVERLADKFHTTHMGLKGSMYDEVLHLYTEKSPDLAIPLGEAGSSGKVRRTSSQDYNAIEMMYAAGDGTDTEVVVASSIDVEKRVARLDPYYAHLEQYHQDARNERGIDSEGLEELVDVSSGGREVFVFDFGAVVFWGSSREEVGELLSICKNFIVKGRLSQSEFEAGEDDMAFVSSFDEDHITIANDVIMLPENTSVQSRLAVSFAIAQSTVLSIFEARIEEKIDEYKFIPEELADSGRVNLTPKQLGNMIGEVFVIRHDVNLHSEILDIPDYFWKENSVEPLYRMTGMYLEMEPRTEVLNKRLDLLRELLRLVQHQHENAHNVKLEWIVIWLIVVSVVLELYIIVGQMLEWPFV